MYSLDTLLNILKDSLLSRSYFYPPLGVVYFASHPSLWHPLASRILPCLAISVAVLVPMFFFTYIPQAAVLSMLNGPFGALSAVALVCSESSFIINQLARAFLLEEALIDTFDATLVIEGQDALLTSGRVLKGGNKRDGVKKLGKLLQRPVQRFSPRSITEYLISLPLNAIPIVGTVFFLILQGHRTGPSYHSRYYQLKGFDSDTRQNFIKKNEGGYIAFGTMAMVMSLIPLASIVVTFTSTVGAALWAAEIEKGTHTTPGGTVDVFGADGRKKEL